MKTSIFGRAKTKLQFFVSDVENGIAIIHEAVPDNPLPALNSRQLGELGMIDWIKAHPKCGFVYFTRQERKAAKKLKKYCKI